MTKSPNTSLPAEVKRLLNLKGSEIDEAFKIMLSRTHPLDKRAVEAMVSITTADTIRTVISTVIRKAIRNTSGPRLNSDLLAGLATCSDSVKREAVLSAINRFRENSQRASEGWKNIRNCLHAAVQESENDILCSVIKYGDVVKLDEDTVLRFMRDSTKSEAFALIDSERKLPEGVQILIAQDERPVVREHFARSGRMICDAALSILMDDSRPDIARIAGSLEGAGRAAGIAAANLARI